jgi:hypothetical protein
VRIFVVVAKNRPDLYQYFMSGFAGVDGVEVILDRRIGPDHPHAPGLETASDNRRVAARTVYEELEQRGFVIVRLPD